MSLRSALAATLAMLGLIGASVPATADDDQAKLVTIVATGEPQTQLMAMVLTMQSVKQGASARVLLCGPGGDLALRDAPASATAPQKPKGMSPQGLMQELIKNGVPVEVCAIYLPNKGLGIDSLLDGIGAAKPPAMAGELLKDDTRLLTF